MPQSQPDGPRPGESSAHNNVSGRAIKHAAPSRSGDSPEQESHRSSRVKAVERLIEYLASTYDEDEFMVADCLCFKADERGEISVNLRKATSAQEPLLVLPFECCVSIATIPAEAILVTDADSTPSIDSHSVAGEGDSAPRTANEVHLRGIIHELSEKMHKASTNTLLAQSVIPEACLAVVVMFAVSNAPDLAGVHALIADTWPKVGIGTQNLPCTWLEDKRRHLQGTVAGEITQHLVATMCTVFTDFVEPLLKSTGVSRYFIADSTQLSSHHKDAHTLTLWDSFVHAWVLQASRAHESGPCDSHPRIFGLVDLINGMPETGAVLGDITAQIANPWDGPHTKYFADNSICLVTSREMDRQEQLVVSYGEISVSSFYAEYGACPSQLLWRPGLVNSTPRWSPAYDDIVLDVPTQWKAFNRPPKHHEIFRRLLGLDDDCDLNSSRLCFRFTHSVVDNVIWYSCCRSLRLPNLLTFHSVCLLVCACSEPHRVSDLLHHKELGAFVLFVLLSALPDNACAKVVGGAKGSLRGVREEIQNTMHLCPMPKAKQFVHDIVHFNIARLPAKIQWPSQFVQESIDTYMTIQRETLIAFSAAMSASFRDVNMQQQESNATASTSIGVSGAHCVECQSQTELQKCALCAYSNQVCKHCKKKHSHKHRD